ncbi:MAG TPA: endonuclease III [Phycisphaerales bacterium]|nr:MAG: endonuclease III [Planctomycetes bacterium GWC2_45_44]HBG78643.1 endonuclease III [Phycisphaerales bacterium]HBR20874.1 endonuclease III [Phycisphaerales bacterium]
MAKITINKQAAQQRIKAILPLLKKTYPNAKCALIHSNPLELLVATILSAQCTDVRVNIVTKTLFEKYKSATDWANAPLEQIEQDIKSTGFYHNKAANIQKACQKIISDFGGKVPDKMEELLTLNGVGRKTANVLLGNAFNTPGVVCDTHVLRLSRRLQLSAKTDDAVKLEFDLMEIVPMKNWTLFSHLLVFHGRGFCKARRPDCGKCPIAKYCPAANDPKLW